ncbi:MAG: hypothetical protein JSV18_03765 [Candidatus Bathyarchaeota archaeon]|nr:MAG: hypothetical protein JSV18_03765 [Candidatus Bathyarchaeota archaeon]
MIVVEEDGVLLFLDILEGALASNRSPSDEEVDRILSTGFMAFMIEAYSRLLDLTRSDVASFLKNLGSEKPISTDPVKSMFEEGFRSCYDLSRIAELRRNVEQISGIDFQGAEGMALSYLPPGTDIRSTLYLTVDAFNPGMVFGGNMGRSILHPVRYPLDLSYLAHEFHHLGFGCWVSRSPDLERAFLGEETHESVAVRLVLHMISEGMANHFCTPNMVRPGPDRSPRVNEKIRRYGRDLRHMLEEAVDLLSDCVAKEAPVDRCEERLMDIVLDREKMLPKVHFMGAEIIGLLDEDPCVELSEIVDLCRRPERFLALYSGVAEKEGFPAVPEGVAELLIDIIRGLRA